MTLAEWLDAHDKTDAWLATEIGLDRSFVTKLKNGTAEPSLRVAREIVRVTAGAVTPNDFLGIAARPEPAGAGA